MKFRFPGQAAQGGVEGENLGGIGIIAQNHAAAQLPEGRLNVGKRRLCRYNANGKTMVVLLILSA